MSGLILLSQALQNNIGATHPKMSVSHIQIFNKNTPHLPQSSIRNKTVIFIIAVTIKKNPTANLHIKIALHHFLDPRQRQRRMPKIRCLLLSRVRLSLPKRL
jgi:hypothetical protein